MEDPRAPSVHYMGLFLPDDGVMMEKQISNVSGKFMTQWWDNSAEAGPARRPSSSFETPMPTLEILTVSDFVCKNLRFASNFSPIHV